jgi:hypothetical protein
LFDRLDDHSVPPFPPPAPRLAGIAPATSSAAPARGPRWWRSPGLLLQLPRRATTRPCAASPGQEWTSFSRLSISPSSSSPMRHTGLFSPLSVSDRCAMDTYPRAREIPVALIRWTPCSTRCQLLACSHTTAPSAPSAHGRPLHQLLVAHVHGPTVAQLFFPFLLHQVLVSPKVPGLAFPNPCRSASRSQYAAPSMFIPSHPPKAP